MLRDATHNGILEALWAQHVAMTATGADRTVVYYLENVIKAIAVIRDDNFKPDALAIALEEASVVVDVWRVKNDPAFDATIHETSPGLER